MYKKLLPFFLAGVFTSPALAQDMIALRSGENLQGQILYFDNFRAQIRTPQGGKVVPVNQISTVSSANRVIENQLNEAIANASMQQTRVIEAAPVAVPVDTMTNIIENNTEEIIDTSDKFWGADWSGNINLGADLKTGNSESSGINADAQIKAKWEKHRLGLEGEYNREEDDGDVNVDNRWAKLTHDYFFARKWFIETSGKYEQDEIADIDYRATIASGLGYQPYDEDDLSLKFVLGPGYQFEEFENGTSGDSTIVNWAMDYSQKFYDDLFRLFHNHDITAPTEDFDAWLFQSESGIRVPIRRGIVATGEVDFDWDNDPAPGKKEDDTTYAIKLGYEW